MKSLAFSAGAVLVGLILLPPAFALTPRNFDYLHDNQYTYLHPGDTMICGDHVCMAGEWSHWVDNMMSNQMKNGTTGVSAAGNATPDGIIGTPIIMNLGNGWYSSIVPLTYYGKQPIHHVAIVLNGGKSIDIRSAFITPQWDAQIGSSAVTFDSAHAQMEKGETIAIIFQTNMRPTSFQVSSLS